MREAIATAILRTAWVERHGPPTTLLQKLAQERAVLTSAGCELESFDATELTRVRTAHEPLHESTDMRTAVECLYGDDAAASLGFTPRGIPIGAAVACATRLDAK